MKTKKYKYLVLGLIIGVLFSLTTLSFAADISAKMWKVGVFLNGTTLKETSNAIFSEGDIYLPAKYFSNVFNMSYSYSDKTGMLTLNNRVQQNSASNFDKDDLELIKMYAVIANQYNRIYLFGEQTFSLSNRLSVAFDEINLNNKNDYLKEQTKELEILIEDYKQVLELTNKCEVQSENFGISISDMYTVLNNYYNAIENLNNAHDALYKYWNTRDVKDFYEYDLNRKYAVESIYKQNIYTRYVEYQFKVINY